MERRKGSDASSSSASVTPSPDYEVMMKLTELRSEKRPLEMDNELRLLLTHYLDDSFTVFNHITKAMLCQRAAELYDMAGFKRKRAFYLRLSVLFQLHGYSTVDITRTVSDYKVVYPILLRTLRGYSIRNLSHEAARSFVFNAARLGPAEIQIRALHELFMAAQRAEEYDAALRHVCYLLQVYLNVMEDGGLKSIGEMQKMLAYRATKTDTPPSLSTIVQPAAAPGVRLPPLIFSRFPLFSDWKPKPLEEHLRPHAVSPTQPRLFVYCAFEDRSSQSEAVVWVVDCPSFIVVQVTNPSPVALRIDDLRLRLAGCDADAQPVNFSLEPGEKREERIPVVPRSEGELRLCGYAWSVFGIRTAADAASLAPDCDRPLYIEGDDELDCDGELTGGSEDPIMTVEVLPSLPTVESCEEWKEKEECGQEDRFESSPKREQSGSTSSLHFESDSSIEDDTDLLRGSG